MSDEAPKAEPEKKAEKKAEDPPLQPIVSADELAQIRAGTRKKGSGAPESEGPKCARCSRVVSPWPIKSIDKGHHESLDIAPLDRAFKKIYVVDGKKKGRIFCARCLLKPKVLRRVLRGKAVARVTVKEPKPRASAPKKKTFKREA